MDNLEEGSTTPPLAPPAVWFVLSLLAMPVATDHRHCRWSVLNSKVVRLESQRPSRQVASSILHVVEEAEAAVVIDDLEWDSGQIDPKVSDAVYYSEELPLHSSIVRLSFRE